jgi:Dyp-type peroxidase family
MPISTANFEAPAQPFFRRRAVYEEASREHEPPLAIDDIQGNIFPGFSKDFQTLLFLRIDHPTAFTRWLGELIPYVATMADVFQFAEQFKALRWRRGGESHMVKATWLNIAFSFAGLKKLESREIALDDFTDEAFRAGLLQRSQDGHLGDPVNTGRAGDPVNWMIGGPDNEADVMLILAGDDRYDLNNLVATVVATLLPHQDAEGRLITSGARLIFRQDGATLNGPLRGHEHFGFRDGISQPGIRGQLPDGTLLTPNQNPLNPNQGKPGQDLLWPGEFVFGYAGQDPQAEVEDPGLNPLANPERKAPEFARNGSFLVFRRLRQDVGAFHRFLQSLATRFQVPPGLVGARMVGRWASGAPAVITPEQDAPALAADDCRNNNFEFGEEGEEEEAGQPRTALTGDCPNPSEPSTDPEGVKVPFAAHIRKVYPRNDRSAEIPELGENSTQTHRLLRRGIPYGPQSSSTFAQPADDGVDRGLLFLAYQTSLVHQFEFVTKNLVNNANFQHGGAGFDPIIGQNAADPNRRRSFRLNLPGEAQPIETEEEWVIPTGGGYFFAPSLKGLRTLASFAGDGGPYRS